jgi:hypothetical protein
MLERIEAAVGLAPSRLWTRRLLGVFPIRPQTCFREGRFGRAGLRTVGLVGTFGVGVGVAGGVEPGCALTSWSQTIVIHVIVLEQRFLI